MAYQVEYLLEVDRETACRWLAHFDGWHVEGETPGEPAYGEYRPWGEISLHAETAETACRLALPQLYYSRLVAGVPDVCLAVERLDGLLVSDFPGMSMLRVDELLLGEWQRERGLEWWLHEHPVWSLSAWLESSHWESRYFQMLGSK